MSFCVESRLVRGTGLKGHRKPWSCYGNDTYQTSSILLNFHENFTSYSLERLKSKFTCLLCDVSRVLLHHLSHSEVSLLLISHSQLLGYVTMQNLIYCLHRSTLRGYKLMCMYLIMPDSFT